MIQFKTILADPPWPQATSGKRKRSKGGHGGATLPYPTMSVDEICALPVRDISDAGCHLWLWTTNSFIESGFRVLREWGFKYLAPIHWIKPSGMGNWVVHRTQTLLLGYRDKCIFDMLRYFPNVVTTGDPVRHSQKPEALYGLIEKVSRAPRLELFARTRRPGWAAWGNEVASDIVLDPQSRRFECSQQSPQYQ